MGRSDELKFIHRVFVAVVCYLSSFTHFLCFYAVHTIAFNSYSIDARTHTGSHQCRCGGRRQFIFFVVVIAVQCLLKPYLLNDLPLASDIFAFYHKRKKKNGEENIFLLTQVCVGSWTLS